MALEMDPGTRTFITLPVFPVEERTGSGIGGGGAPLPDKAPCR